MNIIHLRALAEDRVAVMEKLVIEHPGLLAVHNKMKTLVEHGLRNPDGEKQCMALIAPTGTGKTVMIRSFVETLNTPEERAQNHIPALHVTLKGRVTQKGFVQDILFKIGELNDVETAPQKGNENILLERARRLMKEACVRILIVDEFHHLVTSDSDKVAYTVGETMKWMLICGVCPIVMSGVDAAEKPFIANAQLVRRAIPPVPLLPLNPSQKDDRDVFKVFLAKYLIALEKLGVCKNARALLYGDIPSCLIEMSKGSLGLACKLLVEAVRLMTLDGRNELRRDDLMQANDLLILGKVCAGNPFRDGLKGLAVAG
jgi:Bacterial TniB protein